MCLACMVFYSTKTQNSNEMVIQKWVFFFSTIRLEISFLVTITIGQVIHILRMPHSTLSR